MTAAISTAAPAGMPEFPQTGPTTTRTSRLHERILVPLAIERVKSRRSWILATFALALAALNTASGVFKYLDNTEIFRDQGVTWQVVWGQGGLMWGTFFLPMLITFRAAGLTRMEHEHDNWRRMATYGATITTYTGKLILTTLFAFYCQMAFLLLVMAASAALGFHFTPADIATVTTWAFLGAFGAVTIATAQLLVGIYVPSFATTVLTGMGASFLSLAILLVAPPISALYPYSQVSIGMQARTLAMPTPASIAWFLIWNTILITATVLLSRRALRRKQH
ncbi:ABC transporter permease [Actinomyces sp. oral taxon 170]|uniref:ABC transporter permease n=1 Tax=Actinomyces sp. oral taxon 170 TaxID=712117 RepID=UPI000550ED06|nr:ABC transporter permease [Actinomyces sp. oral taxon 170]